MSWAHRFRVRQHVKGSLWLVPLFCAVAGPGLAELSLQLDDAVDLPPGWTYSSATASTILSAIVAAMVGLTGFVVALGVLIVQMATQTLSPRYMRLWFRDGLQKAVLGTFLGTITFTFSLLRRVESDTVPDVGVTVAGVALSVSLVLFLLYLDHFVHRIRPVAVGGMVADAGAAVFTAAQRTPPEPAGAPAPWPAGAPLLRVTAGRAGAIQAVDRRGLVATAVAHDCVFVVPCAVGDFVTPDTVVLEQYGGVTAPPADRLRGMIAIGLERTIEQDPAFALRVLVDIAIRALSPAVNDPTTAVQLLDRIEQLLELIGESDLRGHGELRDAGGAVRVVLPTPSWEDYLALGVTEIREYGATSTQVTRRLRAVLVGLLERVRTEHRAPVEHELEVLDAILERIRTDEADRRFAGTADRQGIGGSTLGARGWPPESRLLG